MTFKDLNISSLLGQVVWVGGVGRAGVALVGLAAGLEFLPGLAGLSRAQLSSLAQRTLQIQYRRLALPPWQPGCRTAQ